MHSAVFSGCILRPLVVERLTDVLMNGVHFSGSLSRINSELLVKLIAVHKFVETLRALTLLVYFLVVASVLKLFLDFFKQLILLGHQVLTLVIRIDAIISILFVFLISDIEKLIHQLLQRVFVVLFVLLVVFVFD